MGSLSGGSLSGGVSVQGISVRETPLYGKEQAACILLECILANIYVRVEGVGFSKGRGGRP